MTSLQGNYLDNASLGKIKSRKMCQHARDKKGNSDLQLLATAPACTTMKSVQSTAQQAIYKRVFKKLY